MPIHVPNDIENLDSWLTKSSNWKRAKRTFRNPGPRKAAAKPFKLYAIIGVWFEGDIIEAQVKNCFLQGCDRVLLIDNNSPDQTRERAEAVGAEVILNYTTDFYLDDLRIKLMNEAMQKITQDEKRERLWWLALDGDELVSGHNYKTVREVLTEQDNSIELVGALVLDYYPSQPLCNIPGFHPYEFQHNAFSRIGKWPSPTEPHWKHPLIRLSNGVFDICQCRGLHWPYSKGRTVIESRDSLTMSHFMYRNEDDTRARLTALCGPDPRLDGHRRCAADDLRIKAEGAIKRFRTLDFVYSQEWDKVELSHSQGHGAATLKGLVRPRTRFLTEAERAPLRWYSKAALEDAVLHFQRDGVRSESERVSGLTGAGQGSLATNG